MPWLAKLATLHAIQEARPFGAVIDEHPTARIVGNPEQDPICLGAVSSTSPIADEGHFEQAKHLPLTAASQDRPDRSRAAESLACAVPLSGLPMSFTFRRSESTGASPGRAWPGQTTKAMFSSISGGRYTAYAFRRKQSARWSSTIPHACIAAYAVTGPVKRKPCLRNCTDNALEAGVHDCMSAVVRGAGT